MSGEGVKLDEVCEHLDGLMDLLWDVSQEELKAGVDPSLPPCGPRLPNYPNFLLKSFFSGVRLATL